MMLIYLYVFKCKFFFEKVYPGTCEITIPYFTRMAKGNSKKSKGGKNNKEDVDVDDGGVFEEYAGADGAVRVSEPTTATEAKSKLALFALASTASPLILRDLYGFSLETVSFNHPLIE